VHRRSSLDLGAGRHSEGVGGTLRLACVPTNPDWGMRQEMMEPERYDLLSIYTSLGGGLLRRLTH
jgi:hypothetical protein